MNQQKENIIQEFFGNLFKSVSEFATSIFNAEISDKLVLSSDEVQETLFKTKQNIINITKDNIVKSSTKADFLEHTKKSFNAIQINIPQANIDFNLLESCLKNEEIFNKYLMIFEIPDANFKDVKDAIISAEQEKQLASKAKEIKLETKKEPLTEEDVKKQKRTAKIMERVEALLKKFGDAFAKIFRSEGSVLADFGVQYKGKVEVEKSGLLTPSIGIAPTRNIDRDKNYQ
ncbi:MAG: hypothetical protein SFT90_04860 [Rickettsiales bacterium]|nr:hypothetical protein [Rickettsiales bacterium]